MPVKPGLSVFVLRGAFLVRARLGYSLLAKRAHSASIWHSAALMPCAPIPLSVPGMQQFCRRKPKYARKRIQILKLKAAAAFLPGLSLKSPADPRLTLAKQFGKVRLRHPTKFHQLHEVLAELMFGTGASVLLAFHR
jgi:hypothetical protein